jgi:hypothetical protein
VPPLEAWEKVLLDVDAYTDTVHGKVACTTCHAGVNDPDKVTAHTDLISDPSENPQDSCGTCHPNLIESQINSLHYTLQGYETVLATRSDSEDPETQAHIQEMMDNHCASCHTTCGQCHVSQPASVGGGFLDGHVFVERASMSRTCTACHGSRVGNEYLGKNEGYQGDVHFRQGRMVCADCHTAAEVHGEPPSCESCHPSSTPDEPMPGPTHRYDGVQTPRCESCHISAATGADGVEQHQVHGGQLSCQVCHSVAYKSCDSCHTLQTDGGVPYYETDASYMTFLIGLNPIKSYERPYDYVPLRHVPIARDVFDFYGDDLLANFDELPTWRYATPHNIQLQTPQNASCNACHGNAALFLTIDKVSSGEVGANRPVIVDQVPPLIP